MDDGEAGLGDLLATFDDRESAAKQPLNTFVFPRRSPPSSSARLLEVGFADRVFPSGRLPFFGHGPSSKPSFFRVRDDDRADPIAEGWRERGAHPCVSVASTR